MLARLALLALIVSTAHAAAPLEGYGRLPAIDKAVLSPDGKTLAMEQTRNGAHLISIVSLENEKLVAQIRLSDQPVRSLEWADDEHLLITTASTEMPFELRGEKTEWHLLQVYDVAEKKLRPLLDHVPGSVLTMNVVYGKPIVRRKKGETVVFTHGVYVESETLPGLFEINLTTHYQHLLKQGTHATREWIVDDLGQVAAEQQYFEATKTWAIRLFRDGKAKQTVSGVAPIDEPDVLGVSANGDALIVAQWDADGVTWKPLSLSDGTWGPDFGSAQAQSIVLHARGSNRMIGTAYVEDAATYHFLDKELQDGWDWVVRAFRHDRVELESMSADGSRLIVEVFGPQTGYAFYIADLKEHYTRSLGAIYDGVAQIAEVRKITYPAADGLQIPGYLTLPPGRKAEKLPLIAFPHGGPQARDRLEFDWWAQAMAAQGYAVLQPNYRGSDLNAKWVEAGYGEWGRKMQSDVSDGVRYLVSQGIADPARVCIVGASYGGYAALAGVTLESSVYRCAVAVAGVSDPARFLEHVSRKAGGRSASGRYWDRFLGVDNADDKRLDAISPLKHAQNITVPVLLIHGKEDSTVPYEQSEDMATAMKRAGKSFEFVSLAKEDHYLSRSPTRLQMLDSLMEFLRKNNPPD